MDDVSYAKNAAIISTINHSSSSTSLNSQAMPIKSNRTLSIINDSLQQIHKKFQTELLKQLLKIKNVNSEWFDIVMPLVWECVDLVRPDVKHDNDSMDIRNYIKIKKMPESGERSSQIINGLVFTKNLAHKNMKTEIVNPKVLLLRSSIEYQRTEEKLCSLEPVFTAESQYLKNYCSKLLLRQNPNVLIVEKSVARFLIFSCIYWNLIQLYLSF